jgi:hypothetical protein
MSRKLPVHPNLEYLKKQAKRRLTDLQRQQPNLQLADAQHAIAREYGFATWAGLKALVQSVPADVPNPFLGAWRVNPRESAGPATIHFVVAGDTVTITDVTVEADGRERRGTNTLHVDGRDYADAHGYAVAATWIGSRVLEAIAKRSGRLLGRVTYEVASDGETLTVASESSAHEGYPASSTRVVFDRA